MNSFSEDLALGRVFGRRIAKTHAIGEYQFIETVAKYGQKLFHIYINGESIGAYEDSLDAAMIVAIAHKIEVEEKSEERIPVRTWTETIRCEACGLVQTATIEQYPEEWPMYCHWCEACNHVNLESEWNRVEE